MYSPFARPAKDAFLTILCLTSAQIRLKQCEQGQVCLTVLGCEGIPPSPPGHGSIGFTHVVKSDRQGCQLFWPPLFALVRASPPALGVLPLVLFQQSTRTSVRRNRRRLRFRGLCAPSYAWQELARRSRRKRLCLCWPAMYSHWAMRGPGPKGGGQSF